MRFPFSDITAYRIIIRVDNAQRLHCIHPLLREIQPAFFWWLSSSAEDLPRGYPLPVGGRNYMLPEVTLRNCALRGSNGAASGGMLISCRLCGVCQPMSTKTRLRVLSSPSWTTLHESEASIMFHLNVSNVSRADGSSAAANYAYISGEKVADEKYNRILKYRNTERIKSVGNMLPDGAPDEYRDAKRWINDIEKLETRADARPAKKIIIAFPRQLPEEMRETVLRRWIDINLTKNGYPAAYAIHVDKMEVNPHAHVIVANRQLVNGKWKSVKTKTEYKTDEFGERVPVLELKNGQPIPLLDETGEQMTDSHGRLCYKQLEKVYADGRARKQWHRVTVSQNLLDKRETLETMRETWAAECNKELDFKFWISHKSYEERGIELIPQIHEGWKARQREAAGHVHWRCDHNRNARRLNNMLNDGKKKVRSIEYAIEREEKDLNRAKAGAKGKGIGGKLSGAVGAVANEVKGQVKGGLDAIKGGRPDERSGGLVKAFADTLNDGINSAINKSPVGVAVAPFKMPLHVLKNVDCKEVEQMKAEEAEKKKRKAKAKSKNGEDMNEKSPGFSRSRGR